LSELSHAGGERKRIDVVRPDSESVGVGREVVPAWFIGSGNNLFLMFCG
jgi:hypothetical protein